MAYTVNQIITEGIPVRHLEQLEFFEKAGEHGCMTLKGSVEAEEGEALLYGLPQNSPITVRTEDQILFFRNYYKAYGDRNGKYRHGGGDGSHQEHPDGSEETLPFLSEYGDDLQGAGRKDPEGISGQ